MAKRVAFLTAGGIAPCLSACIGALIEKYNQIAPDAELIGYVNGYLGLLRGTSLVIPPQARENFGRLYRCGGSALGNSRVKLTNVSDCMKRGLVKEGESPLEVAAQQLRRDGVNVLHTIGGDDTNTTAADLAHYLQQHAYELTVVGLPKTVDNDVFPVRQTLGAWTAAEQGARFFENVANESSSSERHLIVHEIMGRHCGWLAAATAREYRRRLDGYEWLPELRLERARWDVDLVLVPELDIDLGAECERLRQVMDRTGKVNVFLSEGAGVDAIVREKQAAGEKVGRDAFGHVRIDELDVGEWFARALRIPLGARKVLVQKSGYFARSAPPNAQDLELIRESASAAAEYALAGQSGVAGRDLEAGDRMQCIGFSRIRGGKRFDVDEPWFGQLLEGIGQPRGKPIGAHPQSQLQPSPLPGR